MVRADGLTLAGGLAMSTDPLKSSGEKGEAERLVAETKALVEGARRHEAQQLDLLGVPTAEAILEAREELGPQAGPLAVLAEARKRGRRPGSRNRRTEDFRKFILSFGEHPAITMMKIKDTPEEVMVAQSAAIDPPKRRMSIGDAKSLRVRCAEGLLPFVESKMPVAVDLSVEGDFNLLIPGVNVSPEDATAMSEGTFILADYDEIEGGENGA